MGENHDLQFTASTVINKRDRRVMKVVFQDRIFDREHEPSCIWRLGWSWKKYTVCVGDAEEEREIDISDKSNQKRENQQNENKFLRSEKKIKIDKKEK